MSAAFADRSLTDLLVATAASTAAPGGGCSSAWSAAFAAGLVEMSASLAALRVCGDRSERLTAVAARAAALRQLLLVLGEREMTSYAPVLAVIERPTAEPGRAEALRAALSTAATTPLAIAEAAAELAELACETAELATTAVRGDARAGALLAAGACEAATGLVVENLTASEFVDDERLAAAGRLRARVAAARRAVTIGQL